MRCRGSKSMSCIVSRNPVTTVNGVLSSCETLAMKSRRIRATASSWVTSRESSSFSSMPNGTSCSASVRRSCGCSTTTGSRKSPRLEIAQELRMSDQVHERLSPIRARDSARAAPRRAGSPTRCGSSRPAGRRRRGSPPRPCGIAGSDASGRAASAARIRVRRCSAENVSAQVPRPSGTGASSGPDAQSVAS